MVHRASNVLCHDPLGIFGTAFLHRGRNLTVLYGVIGLPVRNRGASREQPPSHLYQPQRFEDPYQLLVVRCMRERDVKVTAGVMDRDAAAGPLLTRDRSVQLLHIVIGPSLRGKPGDARLHYSPHLQTSHHGVEPEFRHTETTLGMKIHKALTRETSQRLSDGSARDAKPVGEFYLAEPGTRRYLPV